MGCHRTGLLCIANMIRSRDRPVNHGGEPCSTPPSGGYPPKQRSSQMSDRPRGSDNENDDRCGGQYPVTVGIIEANNFMDELMYIVVDSEKNFDYVHRNKVPINRIE